jgi:hypothetical protein
LTQQDGSFEQITLHPKASVVRLQRPQPFALLGGQPLGLALVTVASGRSSMAELRAADAEVVLPDLTGIDGLVRIILGTPGTGMRKTGRRSPVHPGPDNRENRRQTSGRDCIPRSGRAEEWLANHQVASLEAMLNT